MVARLRAKPGAEAIGVTIGDFATTQVDGTFALVYLVINTIMNLTTQDEQVACFANAAAHLAPGGCFVIEVGVPQLQRLPPGETVRAFDVGADHLGFDEFDVPAQGLISHHYRVLDGRLERQLGAVPLRVAVGARPHGPARGDDAARALGRLAARAVHGGERGARLRVGQAVAVPALIAALLLLAPAPHFTFSARPLSPSVRDRVVGSSWHRGCPVRARPAALPAHRLLGVRPPARTAAR